MKITPVEPSQISALLDIQTECDLSSWTRNGYIAEMERSDSVILAAIDPEDGIVGFIAGRVPEKSVDTTPEAEIYNIGTRSAHRSHGVGSSLLRSFIKACRDRGVGSIWLEVRAGNRPAIRFYSAHGFEAMAVRRNFYSEPVEDADIMCLKLA